MIQQKLLVDNLRLGYNGIININDFISEIEDWAADHHMHKEIKKISEFVNKEGKQFEWFVELWKKPSEYSKQVVRIRALFDNITQVKLKRGKHIVKMDEAKCFFIFDGFLESEYDHRWQATPLNEFFRGLFDRYVYKFYLFRYEDNVFTLTNGLHDHLKKYLRKYSQ